jgi:hypothetical protein
MSWWNYVRRDKADREWREEMEAHIEMATDAFLARGMTPGRSPVGRPGASGQSYDTAGGDLSDERNSMA